MPRPKNRQTGPFGDEAQKPIVILSADASTDGINNLPALGATLLTETGQFLVLELEAPHLEGERIEIAEMSAILMAQEKWAKRLTKRRVISNVDNTADIYIMLKCQTKNLGYAKMAGQINKNWRMLASQVYYRYINTKLNSSDIPTREILHSILKNKPGITWEKATLKRQSTPYATCEGVPDDQNQTSQKAAADAGSDGKRVWKSYTGVGENGERQPESKALRTGIKKSNDHPIFDAFSEVKEGDKYAKGTTSPLRSKKRILQDLQRIGDEQSRLKIARKMMEDKPPTVQQKETAGLCKLFDDFE